ncbi:ParB N-terminal domain-containing protein [Variovorax sp. H27-G14]|uniref:ParB N-terminal domain-containing protein n=1 Tax=Variovorax sp. H27-G14 TaxID=3111914 RepID=UPI0038FD162A
MSDLRKFSLLFGAEPPPEYGPPGSSELPSNDPTTADLESEACLERCPRRRPQIQLNSDPGDGQAALDAERTADPMQEKGALQALPPLAPLLGPILQLNPLQVEVSPAVIGRHGSRDEAADEALLNSIRHGGTNSEPVLVRILPPLAGQGTRYQLIYGQRRLHACREAGLPLRAQVEELTETDVLRYVSSSHAGWQEHALIDIGWWARARLEAGQFPSAAALCAFMAWDAGSLSRCISLTEMPRSVTDLFTRSKGLQHRHVSPLNKLLTADRQGLVVRAKAVAMVNEQANFKMTTMELFEALLPKKPASEKLKKPRKVPCADCVFGPGANAATVNPDAAPVNWRSRSPTSLPVVEDDGFDFGDVSSDADGFTRMRYSFQDLTEKDREWIADEELKMLRRAPFYLALQSKAAKKGGAP